jgi:hypothetical protein
MKVDQKHMIDMNKQKKISGNAKNVTIGLEHLEN